MEKQLNAFKFEEAAAALGINQSGIADALGVTRAAVSKWVKGKSFPRPAELLKLGRLLGLRHDELVTRTSSAEKPLVAFRRRASCKTTVAHLERAQEMGRFLRPLVSLVEVDRFLGPGSLKNPSCDYRYLQDLAAKIRRDLDIPEQAPFEFTELIGLFREHQAILIPTLWGHKTKHENALHIFLPDSKTTWIYLNLDVEIHDFKFWMAHELGHVLTLDLLREGKTDEAEDFADAFAGALLFPEPLAAIALKEYAEATNEQGRLNVIGAWAKKHTISPYSVYREIEKHAEACQSVFVGVRDAVLHAYIAKFNQSYRTVSETLFDDKTPTADHFMRVAQERFDTRIYSALGQYVRDRNPGPGVIATVLGVNPMDAKAYLEAFSV